MITIKKLNVILIISALWLVIYLFFNDAIEHNYYILKNGDEVPGSERVLYNLNLIAVVYKSSDKVRLKLKGYSFDELKIEFSLLPYLLKDSYELKEKDKAVYESESCFAVKIFVNSNENYVFVIQHVPSRYSFFLDKPLEESVIKKICNDALIFKEK